MSKPILLVLLFFCLSVTSLSQSRMTPADILRIANVGDAQISPNGQWVVYTVSSVEEDKNFSTLWIARMAPEPYMPLPLPSPPVRRTVPYVDWPDTRSAPRQLLPLVPGQQFDRVSFAAK